MAHFLSDNVAGAHPAIIEAIVTANDDDVLPYGDDTLSEGLESAFSELFEKDVAVIPCVSGTAANALAMSLVAGPVNAVCAHAGSHIYCDECNAPEFFTGGARMTPIEGVNGKLDLKALEAAVARSGDRHAAQPAAITLAQVTETGALYTLEELADLGAFARKRGLSLHMDGARFANAIVALDCRPAEMTWKIGVDVLSFGATKNGCLAAEAVVLFDKRLASEARFRAKRAGQLLSKMRFLSAQLLAYLHDDLWLVCARNANAAARQLYDLLDRHPEVKLEALPRANILLARLPDRLAGKLEQARLAGYRDDTNLMRLCTSWRTGPNELNRVRALLDDEFAAET